MARKKIDMDEVFSTLPELPEGFEQHCLSMLRKIPIFYKRKGKSADCRCGKCGKVFITDKTPYRNEPATCPVCGNSGFWEWRRIMTASWQQEDIVLVQCTTDHNLVLRIFRALQRYQQGYVAEIAVYEKRRYFLRKGDVYKFYNRNYYTNRGWDRKWGTDSDCDVVDTDRLYPGWKSEIERSNLRYCDPNMILLATTLITKNLVMAMLTYANNPAIEMYAKAGMTQLVIHLFLKEGKTALINRRSETITGQLRIKDKAALNRLIKQKGDIFLLKILQREKKSGIHYTSEQEIFLMNRYKEWHGEKRLNYLLRYMTLQQLMNRVEKYKTQGTGYRTDDAVLRAYEDYLKMREELSYDMTNEVYLYPKELKKKHDQMVEERNAKRDDLRMEKMKEKYPDISRKYKKLCQKYYFGDDDYIIRPARDAGEIVAEGRFLHHCVGGEGYLSKHNTGKSTILFLRKKESPDIPYYTIEIRDKEIIQWYGMSDKKPDNEIIGPWLDVYVEQLTHKKQIKAAG